MGKLSKWGAACAVLLVLNSAYLWAFRSASIAYMGNVLVHLVFGLCSCPLRWCSFGRVGRRGLPIAVFGVAAGIGIYLAVHGNLRVDHPVLVAHIAVAAVGVALFLPYARRISPGLFRGLAVSLALLLVLPVTTLLYHRYFPDPDDTISNRIRVPASMQQEGGGPDSPFWPSSTVTSVHSTIPSNYFLESKKCGECHKDIYQQWKSSMHHMASFNNQFYRKAIEYMQSVQRHTRPASGAPDATTTRSFFNGRSTAAHSEQIDTPEAQAGLGCMSCHAIVHVGSTMGNADFAVEYPPLHELASSHNADPSIAIATFLTYLNPEPHRQTFPEAVHARIRSFAPPATRCTWMCR